MITERDRMIIKHIGEHGFITLKQACDIAYNTLGYGYDYARRRFKKLIEHSGVKVKKSKLLDINIYYFDDRYNNPSYHRVLRMDYYCKLLSCGAEIEYFDKEKKWLDGKVISDAVCIYKIGNSRIYNLVEINTGNNKLNLKRFENIIQEFKDQYNTDLIPTIILIDDTRHKIYDTNLFYIIRIDYNMSNFGEVFA